MVNAHRWMFGLLPLVLAVPAVAGAVGGVTFEPNLGQASGSDAEMLARARSLTATLAGGQVVLGGGKRSRLEIEVIGAIPGARWRGVDELPGRVHYFRGAPESWVADVPTFGRARCDDVLPGVDLVLHDGGGDLQLDLLLEVGVELGDVRLLLEGHCAWRRSEGGLVLTLEDGELSLSTPRSFVVRDGVMTPIDSCLQVTGGDEAPLVIGFTAGERASADALVVDPVLTFSTFLGGSATEWIQDVATDDAGNIYLTGATGSADFPTAGAYQGMHALFDDAFVAKLDPTGTTLLYSTYLGGTGVDDGFGIAVDTAGQAHVAGMTSSTDFPTANPLQGTLAGNTDVFVAKLSASGGSLVYSTYLGGFLGDFAYGIAIDPAGNACVAGTTSDPLFPTANALQPALAGVSDAFVLKLAPTGSSLIWSTFLGGTGRDYGRGGIAVDAAGNVAVTGYTSSIDFPTVNPVQGSIGSPPGGGDDWFVSKIDASGSALIYSTYLGGSLNDRGWGIDMDAAGSAYVTGFTDSNDFPVLGAYRPVRLVTDAALARLDPAGALVFSTFFGGSGNDVGLDVAVDAAGAIYLCGETTSIDLPLVDPLQSTHFREDTFVTKLSPSGTTLYFSTYLGGAWRDTAQAIAVVPGGLVVVGESRSGDFPLASPLQPTLASSQDGFVYRVDGISCGVTLCGDCNADGRVDILDALEAGRHAVRLVALTAVAYSSCNVSGALEPDPTAAVDVRDAFQIAAFVTGLPVSLVCCP